MRVLLIEDDHRVADFVAKGLKEHSYVVDHAADGRDGLFLAAGENYDVMVIDRMLPNVDGLTIVRTLRAAGNKTPVLILSALGQVDERVRGLRAGSDDYLVKPFAFVELLARLDALARRSELESTARQAALEVGDLTLDLLARTVTRAGQLIDLQEREFSLLSYLVRHAGQVVTRTMLLEALWDYHFDPQTNVVDVHVSRLRQKIDKPFDKPLIHTVRGAGYVLRATD